MGGAREVVITDRSGMSVDVTSFDNLVSIPVVAGKKDINIVTKVITGVSSFGTAYPYMLVDLDNSSGKWPHSAGGTRIDVHWIDVYVAPGSSFRGNVRVGGIISVSSTAANSPTIFDFQFNRRDELVSHALSFPMGGVLQGDFSNWFGPTTTSSTIYKLGVSSCEGPDGSFYEPGSGDIVMDVLATAVDADVTVSIGYTVIGG